MLCRLIIMLSFVQTLIAQDWPKVCQQALGWGDLRPSKKELPIQSSQISPKGCPVDESCSGDIFDKENTACQKSHEMAKVARHEVPSHEVPSHEVTRHEVTRYEVPSHEVTRYEVPSHEVTRYEVVVFVSFSMPEASLKALSDAAPKHKAVLVMRGLYEDSFVKTSAKLQQMGVMIDINPPLFEEHHIERVPVFIKVKQGKEVARLSGNVSLAFAVSKLEEAT